MKASEKFVNNIFVSIIVHILLYEIESKKDVYSSTCTTNHRAYICIFQFITPVVS